MKEARTCWRRTRRPREGPTVPDRLSAEDLPRAHPKPLAIRVKPAAERALRDGHPWLFEESVVSESRRGAPGDVAVVFDRKNRFLAVGLYDPEAVIRVRILGHGEPVQVGRDLFQGRLRRALGLRVEVASSHTTGYRVLHGENDGLPGLVADLYHRTLVLKLYTPAWIPRLPELLPPIQELVSPDGVLCLVSRRVADGPDCPEPLRKGALLAGTIPRADDTLPFMETGLRFEAHPLTGHKTGFYLDQRENRRRLEESAEGARVLNVFSYSGAFSVYAARGGATEVISVDQAGPALEQARRHFVLNGGSEEVAACRHRTVAGDAFRVLDEMARAGEGFDVVVVDPPSFAKEASQKEGALESYGRLTRLALSLLPPGGLLAQASCSSRVPAGEFFAGIHRTAEAVGRGLEEVERTGHPPDHPVGFPEGAYLKCLWARVD